MRSWGTWNPWRELRARSHITFELDPIAGLGGGAVYSRRGDEAAIVIDPGLDRVQRKAALAHELVHDERGGMVNARGAEPALAAGLAREEVRVHRVVAERLVPLEALAALIRARVDVEAVTASIVADEFDVPATVALEAMRLLAHRQEETIGGVSHDIQPTRSLTVSP